MDFNVFSIVFQRDHLWEQFGISALPGKLPTHLCAGLLSPNGPNCGEGDGAAAARSKPRSRCEN